MEKAILYGSRLKLNRALQHIQELDKCLKAFNETDFCKVHIEEKPDTGEQVVKVDFMAAPPPEIPAIVGDVIHNLKTALEFITFHVTHNNRIYFPKYRKPEEAASSNDLQLIKEKSPELASFIADEVQPYEGGKHRVWEATQLDNADKHRVLVTVVGLAFVSFKDESENFSFAYNIVVKQGGSLKIPNPFAQGIKNKVLTLNGHGKPQTRIFFRDGEIFQNEDIVQTLIKIWKSFVDIVDRTEVILLKDLGLVEDAEAQ